MNIETETNPTYVIRISHVEAVKAAQDPAELQALINAALGYKARRETARRKEVKPAGKRGRYKKRAAKAKTPNWATNGDAGHKARGAAVKQSGTAKCEGCGKKMKVQGIGPHRRHCAEYQLKQAAQTAKAKVLSGVE
jgi:hypothetical protein